MGKPKKWTSMLLLVVAISMAAGCSNNPLGMSDVEWELLTPTQQFEARKIQDVRNEAARVRRAEQEAQEAAEYAQLLDLRRNAAFGDVVQCTITEAQGHFAKGKWRSVQPISVEMHRSEADRSVNLPRQDRPSTNVNLHMSFDGLNVKVCRWSDRDCNVLVGTEAQFRRGIAKHISVKNTVEGTLFCSFPRGW